MNKIILAVLVCLSIPAFADKPAPHIIRHKKHKKIAVVVPPMPPVVVVVPPLSPEVPPVIVPPEDFIPPPLSPIIKPCKVCAPYGDVVYNLHLAIGVGVKQPYASGLVGFRVEFPKVYLGVEPFISIPFGIGVDGLVYAYRGKVVQFYPLSVGFMLNFNYNNPNGVLGKNRFLSDQDINRVVDLRLGLGAQFRLACKWRLSLDLRTSIPDPAKLIRENGICHNCVDGSVALNSRHAVANAFGATQLLVGVLFN